MNCDYSDDYFYYYEPWDYYDEYKDAQRSHRLEREKRIRAEQELSAQYARAARAEAKLAELEGALTTLGRYFRGKTA